MYKRLNKRKYNRLKWILFLLRTVFFLKELRTDLDAPIKLSAKKGAHQENKSTNETELVLCIEKYQGPV